MQPVQDITVDDRVSRTQYQYTLESPNNSELNDWANKFVAKLKRIKDLQDVATDQQTGARALFLSIDRVTASRQGIAPYTIDNTLYDAYGQREINTLYTQLNQYHVILETQPEWRDNPANLSDLYIQPNASSGTSGSSAVNSYSSSAAAAAGSNATTTSVLYTPSAATLSPPANALSTNSTSSSNTNTSSSAANAVPLSAFTHLSPAREALTINHQGQFPSVTVSFNLASDAALGTAITEIDKLVSKMHFPGTLQGDFQGTAAALKNSLSNEALLILAALVTVYIVLGVLYESFIHPVTILSTLPSAGVGALLALMLFRQELSVVAIIGIILLIGIVKKNGINDGRLCARSRASRGEELDRSNLSGQPAAFSSDHDDHHGCIARRTPACAGSRTRLGVASAARNSYGWRPVA
jgi:multidrug efflux pump